MSGKVLRSVPCLSLIISRQVKILRAGYKTRVKSTLPIPRQKINIVTARYMACVRAVKKYDKRLMPPQRRGTAVRNAAHSLTFRWLPRCCRQPAPRCVRFNKPQLCQSDMPSVRHKKSHPKGAAAGLAFRWLPRWRRHLPALRPFQ